VQKKILEILKQATGIDDIILEKTKDEKFGDYSLNTAMVLAKKQGVNPRKLAAEIVERIISFDGSATFKKVEI
jgi:arginyl-tRNA synthetase